MMLDDGREVLCTLAMPLPLTLFAELTRAIGEVLTTAGYKETMLLTDGSNRIVARPPSGSVDETKDDEPAELLHETKDDEPAELLHVDSVTGPAMGIDTREQARPTRSPLPPLVACEPFCQLCERTVECGCDGWECEPCGAWWATDHDAFGTADDDIEQCPEETATIPTAEAAMYRCIREVGHGGRHIGTRSDAVDPYMYLHTWGQRQMQARGR